MNRHGSRVSFKGPEYPKLVRYHQGLRVLTKPVYDWLDTNYFAEMSIEGDGSTNWTVVLDFASEDGAEAFVNTWGFK